jgi:5-methylcytosine-specific restriction protein A
MPRLKVCSVPGCPNLQPDSRCPEHQRDENRYRRTTTPTKIHEPRDRARRKAAVDNHRTEHGDWCPGWNRPPHPSADLTADHITEISDGGHPHGELQILCRSCNAAKARSAQLDAKYRTHRM